MKQNGFIRNVSANTFQLVINQLAGLVIFYVLSKGLSKENFGQVNWSLAVLLTIFGILTLGMDQITVKRLAANNNGQSAFSAYLFHVLISGGIFYGLLLLSCMLFPALFFQQSFLVLIGAGKLLIFFSNPFKQLASGLEKFNVLCRMSVVSNIVRAGALLLIFFLHRLTMTNVFIIFICGDLAELTVCILLGRHLLQPGFTMRPDKKARILLMKESIPQAGVVLFSAVMARFDWILIGLLVSGSRLAEYSFAWKVFEVSTLPLLIIAPIMIPLFTRIKGSGGNIDKLSFFLEWQIIVACFIGLMLNMCWTPVIDLVTGGKYGATNSSTVFILSLGMPVLYLNNFLWTINFAEGKLKFIFKVMACSFAANIISCAVLIPLYKNEGAAVANLITLCTQLILYAQKTSFRVSLKNAYYLLLWPVIGAATGFVVKSCITNPAKAAMTAVFVFLLIILVSGKLRPAGRQTLQAYYR